jgi:murein DD-endopeptidase MepM/ murein hydrolase activator NlpD
MKRLVAVALVALTVTGTAGADSFRLLDPFTLPGADAPNLTAGALFPTAPPAQPQQLSFADLQPIWQAAGAQYGVDWTVLAAINKVESDFGRNMGPSSAGAIGWMQFMPDTWARWGTDADGDGVADPWNATDAIYSAARYLAAAGGQSDISRAVFAYNHAQWYVDEVLQLAQVYAGGGADVAQTLEDMQARIDAAKQAVLEANGNLLSAEADLQKLQSREDAVLGRAETAVLLTARLDAQKQAVLLNGRVQDAQAVVDARRADLEAAQSDLDAARSATSGASFSPGTAGLVGAPAYSNGYVFPVGGGPGVVRVGHTHHDYPAADIEAPEGSPLYALSSGVVQDAWTDPHNACGIGFTIATTDGLTWTYCHMSYLEPTVTTGAQLAAGDPVGFVGHTGHADGPHLHLQLQPADAYPQQEPWFQSFAGTAFTWTDDVQTNPARQAVFAVVDEGSQPMAAAPAPAPAGVVLFNASS